MTRDSSESILAAHEVTQLTAWVKVMLELRKHGKFLDIDLTRRSLFTPVAVQQMRINDIEPGPQWHGSVNMLLSLFDNFCTLCPEARQAALDLGLEPVTKHCQGEIDRA